MFKSERLNKAFNISENPSKQEDTANELEIISQQTEKLQKALNTLAEKNDCESMIAAADAVKDLYQMATEAIEVVMLIHVAHITIAPGHEQYRQDLANRYRGKGDGFTYRTD